MARPAPLGSPTSCGGHWTIENGLHYLRDVTIAEDASQLRAGTGPQVMACLRNLAIGGLCRAGPTNLAAALRQHAVTPTDPWPPSASPSDEADITQAHQSPRVVRSALH